jgi:hypothetical protein
MAVTMTGTDYEPICSTLDVAAWGATGAARQAALVDLIHLSMVAKQAHCNLVGRQFHDVHLCLEEFVETARKYSDAVAERAAASVWLPKDAPVQWRPTALFRRSQRAGCTTATSSGRSSSSWTRLPPRAPPEPERAVARPDRGGADRPVRGVPQSDHFSVLVGSSSRQPALRA